ncbi:Uncharacterized protein Fot_40748 [Forsythia ovata]|uniref:Uncharacterized protein n=1 Tax=Forsythia ovata TaxID=205694 RepID=A0ABD1S8J6_9LAMI
MRSIGTSIHHKFLLWERSRVRIAGDAKEIQFGMKPPVDKQHSSTIVEVGNLFMVWSAGEDETVRQHDPREGVSISSCWVSRQECRSILLSYNSSYFSLFSLCFLTLAQ